MPDHKRILAIALIIGTLAAASFNYTVRSGDTLGRIANQHGTTVRALVEANDIPNPDLIRIGQVLTIPGTSGGSSSGGSSGGTSGTVHLIRPGDTLGRIAAAHGVTLSALISANGITNPNLIFPGRTLVIPGGAGATTTQPTLSQRQWVAPGAGEQAASAHTVAAGETIGRIAARYGVSSNQLIRVNNISNPDLIRTGQVLVIPGGSGWVCPVPGGGFGNDWGAPRSGGRLHRGNDIFAPRGTKVLAPVSGVVSYQTGVLAGLQVTLVGDDGHRYYGTHLDDRGTTGRVVAGQVIGYVGNTGNAATTPPHLHFEIHVDGAEPVNPIFTLRAAC